MDLNHICATVGSSHVPLKVRGSPLLKSHRYLASIVNVETFACWLAVRFCITACNASTRAVVEFDAI